MAKGSPNNQRIVRSRHDGLSEVVESDHERASAVTNTQRQAIDAARPMIRNAGDGELRIKGQHGCCRESNTIGPIAGPLAATAGERR
jgi:hypothetical protein